MRLNPRRWLVNPFGQAVKSRPGEAPEPRRAEAPARGESSLPSQARVDVTQPLAPSKPAPIPGAVLAILTAPERAALANLSPRRREQLMRWLATGDRILVAEARSALGCETKS